MWGTSLFGESESCLSPGDGVLVVLDTIDTASVQLLPSEPARSRTPDVRVASAAAVATAASSTVPVW